MLQISQHEIYGLVAALFGAIGGLEYILRIFGRDLLLRNVLVSTHPRAATWIVWSAVGMLIAPSYVSSGADDTAWAAWTLAIEYILIALFSIIYDDETRSLRPFRNWLLVFQSLDRTEWVCLACAALAGLIWYSSGESGLGLIGGCAVDLFAAFPTIRQARTEPTEEPYLAWVLTIVGNAFNLLAVSNWSLTSSTIWFYPVYMLLVNGTILLFLTCHQVRSNINPTRTETRASPRELRNSNVELQGKFIPGFDPQQYVETYYPPIGDISKLLEISREIRQQFQSRYSVDINGLQLGSGVEQVILENVALLYLHSLAAGLFVEAFPSGGISILDIGGGPTIYQHILASLCAGRITHSDYLQSNRLHVLHWLHKNETAHNWDDYILLAKRIICDDQHLMGQLRHLQFHENPAIQKNSKNILWVMQDEYCGRLKRQMLSSVKWNVTHCDIFDTTMSSAKTWEETFDVVTANFVIESATDNHGQWLSGMQNMISQLRVGGLLVQSAIRNSSWYQVGEKKVRAFPVAEEDFVSFCKQNSLQIIYLLSLDGSDKSVSGYDGMIFLVAQKYSIE